MIKKIFLLFSLLCICMTLCACSNEQREDIFILYTNDTASELHGDISFSNIKGYKDRLVNEGKGVFLVDAGDFLD